ncbi:ABC transporter substrate-binding protein [Craterilacuibacter sp.]|uniref:ABC transporter substrate-binding protein n=1 Tax=Craterilacuibacter sp. TaxID=2870909 RepID=UPI003F3B9225
MILARKKTWYPVVALSLLAAPVHAACPPSSYPAAYRQLLEAARQEGKLSIFATTDYEQASALLADFRLCYPFIRLSYHELPASKIDAQVRSDAARGQTRADVVWSSAMDLQVRLVNDGFSQRYVSPERSALPGWAHWRDETWGTTFEPVVFAWNRTRIRDSEVPATHEALQRLLPGVSKSWRLTGYDAAASGVGYLFLTQDARYNPAFWALARELAKASTRHETSSSAMLGKLASGDADFAYNVIGPYAAQRAQHDPRLGWRIPQDYTLVVSRLTLITAAAPHPAAARLWTDYILSLRGQQQLSASSTLPPVRNGLPRRLGQIDLDAIGERLRPIQVGTGLLVYLDRAKKRLFLQRWYSNVQRPTRSHTLFPISPS